MKCPGGVNVLSVFSKAEVIPYFLENCCDQNGEFWSYNSVYWDCAPERGIVHLRRSMGPMQTWTLGITGPNPFRIHEHTSSPTHDPPKPSMSYTPDQCIVQYTVYSTPVFWSLEDCTVGCIHDKYYGTRNNCCTTYCMYSFPTTGSRE